MWCVQGLKKDFLSPKLSCRFICIFYCPIVLNIINIEKAYWLVSFGYFEIESTTYFCFVLFIRKDIKDYVFMLF